MNKCLPLGDITTYIRKDYKEKNMSFENSIPSSESISSTSESDSASNAELSSGESDGSSEAASSEVSELQDQIQEAKDNGATKQEIKDMIEEFELKVNGKTIKHKFDYNDKEAIKRELQKAYAFNDVSNEYAQVRKGMNAKLESWKSQPEEFLKDLGLNKQELLEKWAKEELEQLQMDPKDRALKEKEMELERYKEMERQLQEEKQRAEQEKQDKEALDFLRSEINEALSAHSFLKPSPALERRVADMMAYQSSKNPNVSAQDVLPMVENEIISEFNEIIASVPEEYIAKLLKDQSLEKIAKKIPKPQAPVKKVVPPTTTQAPKPTTAATQAKAQEPARKKTFEEVMAARR